MTGDLTIALGQVPEPDEFGTKVEDEGVIEAIPNPGEKRVHSEKDPLLTKLIQLGVSIKKSGGDELVEDTHGYGWKQGKKDIVE